MASAEPGVVGMASDKARILSGVLALAAAGIVSVLTTLNADRRHSQAAAAANAYGGHAFSSGIPSRPSKHRAWRAAVDAAFDNYRNDSRKLLYRVRDALNEYNVKVVGARGQAVRLFYDQPPHVDIVPAVKRDSGGYFIPSGDTDFWGQH
jgi:hypothetical protein